MARSNGRVSSLGSRRVVLLCIGFARFFGYTQILHFGVLARSMLEDFLNGAMLFVERLNYSL